MLGLLQTSLRKGPFVLDAQYHQQKLKPEISYVDDGPDGLG
jgi:hypothetical protein